MVSTHTTQPFLSYKLTTIQLVNGGTTLWAGNTIKLSKDDSMLIIQDIFTRTHEQHLLLTARQYLLHAMLVATYCSC